MTYVSQEDTIRAFVNEDPKVEAARRNLRVAKSEAESTILNHLGHMRAAEDKGGAVFRHRALRLNGPLLGRITHYTILGDLARVTFYTENAVLFTQEMTLMDLFTQIGGWITDGPRPADLA